MKVIFKSFINNIPFTQMTNVDNNVTGLQLNAYTNIGGCKVIVIINNIEFSIKRKNMEEAEDCMNFLYDLICTNKLLDPTGNVLYGQRPEAIVITNEPNDGLIIEFKYIGITKIINVTEVLKKEKPAMSLLKISKIDG